MKNLLALLLLVLVYTNVQGQQDEACRTFRTGKFRYENPDLKNTLIIRKRRIQEEIHLDSGKKFVLRIRWKSDCEYELKFLKRSTLESELIGKTMRVTIVSIDGNRYQYAVLMKGLPIITGWMEKTGN